jgi:hypothetical protein
MRLSRIGRLKLTAERVLLLLAFVPLTMGVCMWALRLEQPGRIIQAPVAGSDGDCHFDSDLDGVVAPYVVTGRNDGDVWLRIEAGIEGRPSPVGIGAMKAPDGTYAMRGDVLVPLTGDLPGPDDRLACQFTAGPWE